MFRHCQRVFDAVVVLRVSYLYVHVHGKVQFVCFFFFKQKTAYEMRISDWSSDVCSSDLELRSDPHLDRKPRADSLMVLRRDQEAGDDQLSNLQAGARSEERRGGKECVSTSRSRWSPYH